MKKYRNTKSRAEIFTAFDSSLPAQSFVWQTINGERSVFEIEDIRINKKIRTAKIILKDWDSTIDPKETIYLRLSQNESVTKLKCLSKSYNEISVFLPEEIQSLENREFPRTLFAANSEKFATLILNSELTSNSSQALKFNIMDISERGVSLMISEKNKSLFKNSESYFLSHLGEYQLEEPIKMGLRYFKLHNFKVRGRSYRTNRAGLLLEQGIDPQALTMF